ncbi:MAG TPA: lamin tail domain-containing protein, partial [Clostridia bacterium]|nr:lamin tail domain-containing protein [Clostridia bacterium]
VQAENLTSITNAFGQPSPWIELFNPGPDPINLEGFYLANRGTNLAQWPFPAGSVIAPNSFKLIFADGQTNWSSLNELHANFTLNPATGQVALSRVTRAAPMQVVDALRYTGVLPNHSFGSVPDGQSFDQRAFFYPTPASTNNASSPPITVFINEWMADNSATLADPADTHYEDWFEIYNPGTNSVDLGGCYLTDDLANKTQFRVPDNSHYLVPPGGYLLVWADNESAQNNTNQADLHVDFALSKGGEAIGLFAADGTQIDAVSFGAQQSDISQGRFRDGSATIVALPAPTPRAANAGPNSPPVLQAIPDVEITLGQTVSFTASAHDTDLPAQSLTFRLDAGAPDGASIHPVSGAFAWKPAAVGQGITIGVVVEDDGMPSLSATQSFEVTVLAPPGITVQLSDGQIRFAWPRGTLQEADEVTGPYADVPEATSPFTPVLTSDRRFYRIRL